MKFKEIIYEINLVCTPFDNLRYRDKTALLLIRDREGKFLLADKGVYPKGVYRFLGGGVEEENVLLSAQREMREETGLFLEEDRFEPLISVEIKGSYKDKVYKHQILIFFVQLGDEDAVAGDDVKEIIMMTKEELRKTNDDMAELPESFLCTKPSGESFSWRDYGKVYGFVQNQALEALESR